MDAPAIVCEDLCKRYGKVTALNGFGLAAPEGAVYGLLGPNGAGKTTVVRVLATLLYPDSGRAEVAGFDVTSQPDQVRAAQLCCSPRSTWRRLISLPTPSQLSLPAASSPQAARTN